MTLQLILNYGRTSSTTRTWMTKVGSYTSSKLSYSVWWDLSLLTSQGRAATASFIVSWKMKNCSKPPLMSCVGLKRESRRVAWKLCIIIASTSSGKICSSVNKVNAKSQYVLRRSIWSWMLMECLASLQQILTFIRLCPFALVSTLNQWSRNIG
jgi:hypothetical protein